VWHEYGEMARVQTEKRRHERTPSPLTGAALRDLALSYVARFATSGAKLEGYLARKLRERGLAEGEETPDIRGLVARLVELGYVDDEAFARARAGGLLRRGYGGRRVEQSLRTAGIDEELRSAVSPGEADARRAAFTLARRRGFGPFGEAGADRARREKQLAAMIRAGHNFDIARFLIEAESVQQAETWLAEAEEP